MTLNIQYISSNNAIEEVKETQVERVQALFGMTIRV